MSNFLFWALFLKIFWGAAPHPRSQVSLGALPTELYCFIESLTPLFQRPGSAPVYYIELNDD